MTGSATVLTGVRIWDGERSIDADAVRFQRGRITAIGDAADLATPASDVVIESHPGTTLLPGLIDAHVHLELDPDNSKPPAFDDPRPIPRMAERAQRMLTAGITTARDLGGGRWAEITVRNAIDRGEYPGPRLLCAGQPITSPDGHCHFWGGVAQNLEAAYDVMDRQRARGVDLIKVMATGGRFTKTSDPLRPQFDTATLTAIVDRAHEHALPVAAHCHGTEGIRCAAEAGVNTIEHCSWVGEHGWGSDYQDDVADVIQQQGIWVSPTVNAGWQRMLDSKTGNVLNRMRTAYRAMIEKGIPFAASTDAGIPGVFHHDLPKALAVFSRIAELSPAETLRSATYGAARAIGIAEITGRIRVGLAADLLLIDGDPLENLATLNQPVAVWARGNRTAAL